MRRSDVELIRRAREGDNAAFTDLWHRYEPKVLSLCRRYLAGGTSDPVIEVADIATETFIRALHALDRYEDRSEAGYGFETWLLEIAKRLCLRSHQRFRRRQQWQQGSESTLVEQVHAPTGSPVDFAEERELLQTIAEAINALPHLYRQPFKLYLEEYTHKEIAALLGIRVDAVMQRIHRARRLLQPRLAPQLGIATTLESAEQALAEIVHDSRIISVALPSGGELQLCLRVERRFAHQEAELSTRRRRLQRHPRAWKVFLEYAELCYHFGRWKEAKDAYHETLTRNPACFGAALRLGGLLRQAEQKEAAATVYADALAQSPPPAFAARLQAEWLLTQGALSEAVATYELAISLDPTEPANYQGIHHALGRLSRYEEQLENLARLRQIAPQDLFGYDEAYLPCARLGRWDQAQALLEQAVALDPNYPPAVKHLFQVRMNQRRFDDEALALAERLVSLAPRFVDSWSELAWIYDELGREVESIAVLQQFLSEHPTNAAAHAALAWRYHYQEKHEASAYHAQQAYLLAPHDWHVCWTVLTACHVETKAIPPSQWRTYAREIEARFPQHAFLLNQLCNLFALWGQTQEALGYAHRLRLLQPDNPALAHLTADIYRLSQQWERAAQEYHQVLAHSQERPPLLVASLGEALEGQRDPGAVALFDEAERQVSTWQELHFMLDLYWRCGLIERLVVMAQRLLQLPDLTPSLRRYVLRRLQDRDVERLFS